MMFGKRKGLLFIIAFLILSGGWELRNGLNSDRFLVTTSHEVRLSEQRKTHILYGDRNGGGHMYGIGHACKSEFPKDWDEDKIISTVHLVASNDNLNWKREKNGYYVAEDTHDGVVVRVVLDREKDDVVTAYPLNAKRNPCPKPANDNYNE